MKDDDYYSKSITQSLQSTEYIMIMLLFDESSYSRVPNTSIGRNKHVGRTFFETRSEQEGKSARGETSGEGFRVVGVGGVEGNISGI